MWEFASGNPFTAFLIAWIVAWAVTRPFHYAFMAYNRTLRSRNIKLHGWPTPPTDADGDVVYPDKDDEAVQSR